MGMNLEKGYKRIQFLKRFRKKKYLYLTWCSIVDNTMEILSTLLASIHKMTKGELGFEEITPFINDYIAAIKTWRHHELFHTSLILRIDDLMNDFINVVSDYTLINEKGSQLETYRKMFAALDDMKNLINDGCEEKDVDFNDVADKAKHKSFIASLAGKNIDIIHDLMSIEVKRESLLRYLFANIAQVRGYLITDFLEICEGIDIVAERKKRIKVKDKQLLQVTFVKADKDSLCNIQNEECD